MRKLVARLSHETPRSVLAGDTSLSSSQTASRHEQPGEALPATSGADGAGSGDGGHEDPAAASAGKQGEQVEAARSHGSSLAAWKTQPSEADDQELQQTREAGLQRVAAWDVTAAVGPAGQDEAPAPDVPPASGGEGAAAPASGAATDADQLQRLETLALLCGRVNSVMEQLGAPKKTAPPSPSAATGASDGSASPAPATAAGASAMPATLAALAEQVASLKQAVATAAGAKARAQSNPAAPENAAAAPGPTGASSKVESSASAPAGGGGAPSELDRLRAEALALLSPGAPAKPLTQAHSLPDAARPGQSSSRASQLEQLQRLQAQAELLMAKRQQQAAAATAAGEQPQASVEALRQQAFALLQASQDGTNLGARTASLPAPVAATTGLVGQPSGGSSSLGPAGAVSAASSPRAPGTGASHVDDLRRQAMALLASRHAAAAAAAATPGAPPAVLEPMASGRVWSAADI